MSFVKWQYKGTNYSFNKKTTEQNIKFCILLRIYLRILKKSSTFAAVSVRKARCVISEPPNPRWCGDNPPEIISKWKLSFLSMQTAIPLMLRLFAHLYVTSLYAPSTLEVKLSKKAPCLGCGTGVRKNTKSVLDMSQI